MISPGYRCLQFVQIVFVLLFAAPLQSAPSPTPSLAAGIDEKLFNGMRWRQIGPFRAGHVLLWSSRGRSLEDDRWRRKLDSAFRQTTDFFDWGDRSRAVRSQCDLCRHG